MYRTIFLWWKKKLLTYFFCYVSFIWELTLTMRESAPYNSEKCTAKKGFRDSTRTISCTVVSQNPRYTHFPFNSVLKIFKRKNCGGVHRLDVVQPNLNSKEQLEGKFFMTHFWFHLILTNRFFKSSVLCYIRESIW